MNIQSLNFLKTLMTTPSPCGYEARGREAWRKVVKTFADKVKGDVHGNSIAVLNAHKGQRIMLAGHIDEIAFQVKFIHKEGYIYFNPLGGFDVGIIPGRKVRIHTKAGDVLGVIGRRAIHLIDAANRSKCSEMHDLFIDIGVTNSDEANKLVEIGDPITYDSNFEELRNGLCVSKAFDDKIGAFIVAEVMRNVAKKKSEFKASLYSVATVQEEVGLRGAQTAAYGIDPVVGIAIDVTHATDTPDTSKEKEKFGDVKMNSGVVIARGPNINTKVFELLEKLAKKKKIAYQIEPSPKPTGTDANVMQVTRAGVATGLLSIPCRYMHTMTEIVSMKDVEACITLLTEFCLAIDEKTDFTL